MSSKTQHYDWLDLEQFGENLAVMSNGKPGQATHIVRTDTFRPKPVANDYDGVDAGLGYANALCGTEVDGRMMPADGTTTVSQTCENCLRVARSDTRNKEDENVDRD